MLTQDVGSVSMLVYDTNKTIDSFKAQGGAPVGLYTSA
jgi:hypothetical protein